MLIVAFALSVLFIGSGIIGMNVSSQWGSVAWIMMGIYPGIAGLCLAALGLAVKWIPVISVASPYLAWISCIATLSMITYALGNILLFWVLGYVYWQGWK